MLVHNASCDSRVMMFRVMLCEGGSSMMAIRKKIMTAEYRQLSCANGMTSRHSERVRDIKAVTKAVGQNGWRTKIVVLLPAAVYQ
jgi:hypothetical protein